VLQHRHHILEGRVNPNDVFTVQDGPEYGLSYLLAVHRQGSLFHVGTHLCAYLTWANHKDVGTTAAQCFAQLGVETIETGFGGAVHEVRAAYLHTSNR